MLEASIELIQDLWGFLNARKKYWMAPLIISLVVLGALIIFAQGSAIAPFIYSLF